MGIIKGLVKALFTFDYEVVCKYCGTQHGGSTLSWAIQHLQEDSSGCGENCHEPIITRRPE